jgi:hypothetical protein
VQVLQADVTQARGALGRGQRGHLRQEHLDRRPEQAEVDEPARDQQRDPVARRQERPG